MDSKQRNQMKVVSLNVALPSTQRYGGEKIFTGGAKRPVTSAMLRNTGFEDDGQADTENHGGPDKAVCVYPFDHYAYWKETLGREVGPGSFSENLTISGVLETDACIGDVFRVGGAIVQVSMPRTPCAKLAAKNDERHFTKWVADVGYTGFYMRVLSEGMVEQEDGFELVERHPAGISISDVNDAFFGRAVDPDLISRLSTLTEFGADGREIFAKRLARMRSAS